MNKKLQKALNWIVAIVGIVGTLYFTSSKRDDLQETHLNGKETTGIVIRRSSSRSAPSGTGSKSVHFIFNQDGNWIQGTFYGEEYYEKAIVGMKYKVNSNLADVFRNQSNF